jgi:tRNA 2-selenouridine synthase
MLPQARQACSSSEFGKLMADSITKDSFASLLLSPETRWIDVRAPVEFQEGAVPGARNLPLLTNEERHEVGITYKQEGQAAAIELGHRLVSGPVKAERIASWLEAARGKPAVIYCFRGGLRSQISQQWIKENGLALPVVKGGYKALRRFLLETTESRCRTLSFRVVCGPTGSGKTAYLRESGKPFLDLEKIAMHRGSAFGAFENPQPSQANFENGLALALLRLPEGSEVLVEDESRMIGKRSLPDPIFKKMKASPRLMLDIPLEQRVENIYREYLLESRLGKEGDESRFNDFSAAVENISRKLGGQLTTEIQADIRISRREFRLGRGLESNRDWIRKLLESYYDPLYFRWIRSQTSRD